MTELTEKQAELCELSTTDYSDLKAFFINCTLKRGPESSHTQTATRTCSTTPAAAS